MDRIEPETDPGTVLRCKYRVVYPKVSQPGKESGVPVRKECNGIFEKYLNAPISVSGHENGWVSFGGQKLASRYVYWSAGNLRYYTVRGNILRGRLQYRRGIGSPITITDFASGYGPRIEFFRHPRQKRRIFHLSTLAA